jgi:hypothetical protein
VCQEFKSIICSIKSIKKIVVVLAFLKICHLQSSTKTIGAQSSKSFFILILENQKIYKTILIILMMNLLLTTWYIIKKKKRRKLILGLKCFQILWATIFWKNKSKKKKIHRAMKMRTSINTKCPHQNSISFMRPTTLKKPWCLTK